MKNRLFKFLILCLAVCAVLFTFTACNNGEGGLGDGHTHAYTEEVVEAKYLKCEATCTNEAEYYYSCTCREKGTATFKDGRTADHVYDQKVEEEKYICFEGSCTERATYYYSCECGDCGTETFESEIEPEHFFDGGECTMCGESEDEV